MNYKSEFHQNEKVYGCYFHGGATRQDAESPVSRQAFNMTSTVIPNLIRNLSILPFFLTFLLSLFRVLVFPQPCSENEAEDCTRDSQNEHHQSRA